MDNKYYSMPNRSLDLRGVRNRTIFNKEQKRVLEAAYHILGVPDQYSRACIAQKCALNEDTVRIWFQNRRGKERRQREDDLAKMAPVVPKQKDEGKSMMEPSSVNEKIEEILSHLPGPRMALPGSEKNPECDNSSILNSGRNKAKFTEPEIKFEDSKRRKLNEASIQESNIFVKHGFPNSRSTNPDFQKAPNIANQMSEYKENTPIITKEGTIECEVKALPIPYLNKIEREQSVGTGCCIDTKGIKTEDTFEENCLSKPSNLHQLPPPQLSDLGNRQIAGQDEFSIDPTNFSTEQMKNVIIYQHNLILSYQRLLTSLQMDLSANGIKTKDQHKINPFQTQHQMFPASELPSAPMTNDLKNNFPPS